MVDDVRCKDLDSSLLCKRLCLRHNLHIEGQDHGQVWRSFEHCTGSDDIFLVHGPDVDGGNRNARVVQEVQKCLQSSQGRCLDMNTFPGLVHVFLQLLKVFHHRALELLYIIFLLQSEQRRSCYCSFQTARCNLHAHGGLYALVVDILVLHAQFFHRVRSEESPDGRDDWALHAANHNRVALVQLSMDKDNIERGPEAFRHFDLKNRRLKSFAEHQSVDQHLLGQLDAEEEEIRDAFTGDRRCWNHRDHFSWVLVLVVEISIQSLASYLSLNPLPPAFKLSDCMALLLG
mmetsp:Transcript_14464/g.49409  ORF Transcript_14464/g.49409 Transcript_14464/m.49409 type:complete len:289 (+) Transcript_14464:967-1833(+)